jgi:AraC family transcriptional regulator
MTGQNVVTHEIPEFNQALFASPLVNIGIFSARPEHPNFRQSGLPERHYLVFPRTSVRIQREGAQPFVADPTLVTFYNRSELYFRGKIDERGDCTHSFSLAPAALLEVIGRLDPAIADRPEHPFRLSHAPSRPGSFLAEHRLIAALRAGAIGPLAVEESTLSLFAEVIAAAYAGGAPRRAAGSRQADLAEDARSYLGRHFRQPLSLQQVADALDVSPFHLCRVFRRYTGSTLHGHLSQLRLREALDLVAGGSADLTGLAFDLGYSSHSHFTAAFRGAFGITPSALRAGRTAARCQ